MLHLCTTVWFFFLLRCWQYRCNNLYIHIHNHVYIAVAIQRGVEVYNETFTICIPDDYNDAKVPNLFILLCNVPFLDLKIYRYPPSNYKQNCVLLFISCFFNTDLRFYQNSVQTILQY